ncbi:hypothetical protein AGOR_G00087380 [Albula goreensis]|uniref:Uncharacterized protein n=1 Tax=Albula goreensis TaxID=1534307 RepID=A0A8T3DR68_9TELE|nr:hypothetical protein AGOR_G00087380 [Albula goreensis]
MPPLLNIRYLMILKAVCMLGMLVLFLGPAGCSTKGAPRNREGKTSRDRAARSRGRKPEQTVQLLLDPHVISKSPPAPPPGSNSLSPWNYSYIHDDNLFPSRIPKRNVSAPAAWITRGGTTKTWSQSPSTTRSWFSDVSRGEGRRTSSDWRAAPSEWGAPACSPTSSTRTKRRPSIHNVHCGKTKSLQGQAKFP